ncbi:hypothetical protein CHLRE_03g165169v5 [Chlamydomonas reinhardtii]|uniref:Uncharacterized protein n=1 Tax=Chlamydomonas reinhardtii TaxID=3055 RepID=A0A2K3DWP1_CHLRE|nr:uncharacterized protein CHLRE_03g165169v5 [Chlamydomonas reinhardtii]PNW84945.1 hypothetical protein CHLRE_03g165169v5 [Chlamydomonas reinhardtii]
MAENRGRSSKARWSPGFGPIAMGVDLPSALVPSFELCVARGVALHTVCVVLSPGARTARQQNSMSQPAAMK